MQSDWPCLHVPATTAITDVLTVGMQQGTPSNSGLKCQRFFSSSYYSCSLFWNLSQRKSYLWCPQKCRTQGFFNKYVDGEDIPIWGRGIIMVRNSNTMKLWLTCHPMNSRMENWTKRFVVPGLQDTGRMPGLYFFLFWLSVLGRTQHRMDKKDPGLKDSMQDSGSWNLGYWFLHFCHTTQRNHNPHFPEPVNISTRSEKMCFKLD